MKKLSRSEQQRRRRQSQLGQQEFAAAAHGPCITALELVETALEDLDADREHQKELRVAALCVGQWLADEGRAGQWETVEVARVVAAMGFPEGTPHGDHEKEAFLFCLTTLFGWAGVHGVITIRQTERYMRDIQTLSRRSATVDFAASTLAHLVPGVH